MLYEIHMIKNYPPVNLNRDETGSPKTCYFGGTQRGRISSQCLKRSWRTSPLFSETFKELGIRTRHLPDLVAEELKKRGMPDDVVEVSRVVASELAKKSKADSGSNEEKPDSNDGTDKAEKKEKNSSKDLITPQIIFFSAYDVSKIADKIIAVWNSNPDIKTFKKMKSADIAKKIYNDKDIHPITMDIALFGRMVTSDAFRDVEASVQVANAISTHTVNQESDYYTAMDEMLHGDSVNDKGAGMVGDTDYNSCCYYHYMSIDTDQLRENLKDSSDTAEMINLVLPTLLEVMAYSNPSGKQNTFAGHIMPDLLCVEVKSRKIPCSYVNAFAEPVRFSGNKTLVKDSVHKLAAEVDLMDRAYGLEVNHRGWFAPRYTEEHPEKGKIESSMKELISDCTEWAKEE